MPEEDARIFSDYFTIWKKYRGMKMTEADWEAYGREVSACANRHQFDRNPLAFRMGCAMMDAMGELYMDGKSPAIAGFFERADLDGY